MIDGGHGRVQQHAAFGVWQRDGGTDKATGSMGQYGKLTAIGDLRLPRSSNRTRVLRSRASMHARRVPWRPVRWWRVPPKRLRMFAPHAMAGAARAPAWMQWRRNVAANTSEAVTEAKRDGTRTRRIERLLEHVVEGHSQHWKHQSP